MRLKKIHLFTILVLSAVLCLAAQVKADNADSKTARTTEGKSVSVTSKSIDLPYYPPDFPPGKGRELFISRCGVCHSLRYITMQPDFSEKTWTKEVDKMIKTYGAHIDKKEAREIVDYLNSIKGKAAEKH